MAFFCRYIFGDISIFIVCLIGILYLWFRRRYEYWNNKGVFTLPPTIPFGNMKDVFKGKQTILTPFWSNYERTKKIPFYGAFMVHRPTIVINDLELIKTVLMKEFVSFAEHGLPFSEESDPLSVHLFNVSGKRWKNLRTKLTPTFTSSKMKMMFGGFLEVAEEMVSFLEETDTEKDPMNIKNLFVNYASDVIAKCAFGVENNSFKNPDNEFLKMGKLVFNPNILDNLLRIINFFFSNSVDRYRKYLLGTKLQDFFYNLFEQTVNYRLENGVVRNDFMQLLIELKTKGSVSENDEKHTEKQEAVPDDGTRLTMMQLAAQVFVFFIAGFETSSTTSSFCLYELALNPDIQKTVREEIDRVLEKHDGKLTYDSLGEMTYLNQTVEETLRKYPPLPVLFRVCTKDYIIPNTNISIEKGTPVMIPIYGIQRDPEYYPNPDKFDPERFLPENKEKRPPFTYLPFGEGPRICIGSRFGMMQIKLGIATLLSKYEISVCEKTVIPVKYDIKSFVLTSEGGVWLNIKKRKAK